MIKAVNPDPHELALMLLLGPDPYWQCGSESGSRSKEIYQYLQMNLILSLSKRLLYLRCHGTVCIMTYIKYIFHVPVKLQLFMTAKSDQDPDVSALVWRPKSGFALR